MNSQRRWMSGMNPCIYYSLTAGKILIQLKGILSWRPVKLKRQSMDDYIQHLRNFSIIESTRLDLTVERSNEWEVQGRVFCSAPLVTSPEREMDCTWMERMRRWGLLEKQRIGSEGELAEKWVFKLAQSENQTNKKSRGWPQESKLGLKSALNTDLSERSQPAPLCSHWSEESFYSWILPGCKYQKLIRINFLVTQLAQLLWKSEEEWWQNSWAWAQFSCWRASFGQDDACDALVPPCCPCCSPRQQSEGDLCMLLPNLGKAIVWASLSGNSICNGRERGKSKDGVSPESCACGFPLLGNKNIMGAAPAFYNHVAYF